MFRIDRTLVKISQTRDAVITQAPAAEPVHVELEVEEAIAEIAPEEEPEPSGPLQPSAEELAHERAEEIIREASEKAAELIENARQRAAELVGIAEQEVEQVREEARCSGYDEGTAQARLELEEKLREDNELLRGVIEAIHSERARMQGELEGEVIRLALAVTEKIIKLSHENDDKVFESIIVNALRQMNLEGKITIRVGVREYDRFFSSGGAVFALGDGTTVTATVVKDTTLGDGDLIIDSDIDTINAGIDSQLKYIELAFNRADGV